MQYPKPPSRNTESQTTAQAIAQLLRDGTLLPLLHRIAQRHAYLPKGSMQARELVADVIAEMVGGEIGRDDHDLDEQLWLEVRRRAERWRAEAERDVLVPIDDTPEIALMTEAALPVAPDADTAPRDAEEVVCRLRALARDDPPALQLLEHKLRAMQNLGGGTLRMPPGVYRGARKRLQAYAMTANAIVLNRGAQVESPTSPAELVTTARSRCASTQARIGACAADISQVSSRA